MTPISSNIRYRLFVKIQELLLRNLSHKLGQRSFLVEVSALKRISNGWKNCLDHTYYQAKNVL